MHVKSRHRASSHQGTPQAARDNINDVPASPESSESRKGIEIDQDERAGAFGELDGLEMKLRELETLKKELVKRQSRVNEDIQAVERTMQLVSVNLLPNRHRIISG
jgi:hypothetical protein